MGMRRHRYTPIRIATNDGYAPERGARPRAHPRRLAPESDQWATSRHRSSNCISNYTYEFRKSNPGISAQISKDEMNQLQTITGPNNIATDFQCRQTYFLGN